MSIEIPPSNRKKYYGEGASIFDISANNGQTTYSARGQIVIHETSATKVF